MAATSEAPSENVKPNVNGKRDREESFAPLPADMSLPSAAIARIFKRKLPDHFNVSKDARAAFSKATSLFILYLTAACALIHPAQIHPHSPTPLTTTSTASLPPWPPLAHPLCRLQPLHTPVPSIPPPLSSPCSASEISREAKRSTVSAQDVITALNELEFDFAGQIESCLAAFREVDKARVLAAAAKKSVRAAEAEGDAEGDAEGEEEDGDEGEEEEEEEAEEGEEVAAQ